MKESLHSLMSYQTLPYLPEPPPIDRTRLRALSNLSKEIDLRISPTPNHSYRVAHWVRPVALKLGLTRRDIRIAYWAALLHDIGKIGLPDHILTKRGSLTELEWIWIRLHPSVGAELVTSMAPLAESACLIYAHHERYDGLGYPDGLEGKEIPLGARIISVTDAYDAMTSERVYCKARSHIEAVGELLNQSGRQFDPLVISAFIELIGNGYLSQPLL
jgi:putative nucleotidyltransferase with HDIG domain